MSNYYNQVLPKRTAGQFSKDPTFQAFVKLLANRFDTAKDLTDYIARTFNLDHGEGVWLDLLGRRINQPRNIPFALPANFFGFETQEGGNGFNTYPMRRAADPIGDSVVLTDEFYKVILKTKAAQNGQGVTLTGCVNMMSILFSSQSVFVENTGDTGIIATVPAGDTNKLLMDIATALNITPECGGVLFTMVQEVLAVFSPLLPVDAVFSMSTGNVLEPEYELLNTNTPTTDIQWQLSVDNGNTWVEQPIPYPVVNGYLYRCQATNTAGASYSRELLITTP